MSLVARIRTAVVASTAVPFLGTFVAAVVVPLVAVVALAAAGVVPAAAQPAPPLDAAKPVAPFTVEADALAAPTVGVPVDVRITVGSRAMLEGVEVRIAADPGLSVDPAGLTLYSPEAGPDAPAEWQITVVPLEPGAQRLRLFAEALVGGVRQSRSTVATLRVAEGAGDAAAAEGVGRESAVRSAGRGADLRELGDKSGAEAGGDAGSPAADDPDAERVIRLPAVVRP